MIRRAFPIAVAAALAGCGLTPEIPEASQLAAAKAGGKTYEAFERVLAEGDAAWARRAEGEAQIRKAVEAYEAAFAVDQNDRHVLSQLAIGHYYLAFYFTPSLETQEKAYMKGNGYGVLAAKLNPGVRAAVAAGKTLEEAIAAHATPGDVPALYWMTVSLARAAEPKSLAVRAGTAPKLKSVMETIYRLGPSYYYGGVHRFFGAYYIKAPAQKDPLVQSKREFDRAVLVGKENLENRVLCAEYYSSRRS
jgi:hypothetical protein